jgi:hypothetical protein
VLAGVAREVKPAAFIGLKEVFAFVVLSLPVDMLFDSARSRRTSRYSATSLTWLRFCRGFDRVVGIHIIDSQLVAELRRSAEAAGGYCDLGE